MKKISFFLAATMVVVFASAQDKIINDANAEARNVSGFHAIKISQGIELMMKQGNTEAVAVSASTNEYRSHIITEVVAGVLKIYFDSKWFKGWNSYGKRLKAYVSFKQLDMIDGSSGSLTTIDGGLNGNDVKIELSSGASFRGALNVTSLNVQGASGAVANISGKSQSINMEARSGAVIRGYDHVSDKCDAEAASGGSIQVSVNKELNAAARSGGDIRYKGEAAITKISTGSGGSVKKNG